MRNMSFALTTTQIRKYEGAMLRETLREALTEAYLMGAQNILEQLR